QLAVVFSELDKGNFLWKLYANSVATGESLFPDGRTSSDVLVAGIRDGRVIAVTSRQDSWLVISDVFSGSVVATLHGNKSGFTNLALSPDGSHLFALDGYGRGFLWDHDNRLEREFDLVNRTLRVYLSRDGSRVGLDATFGGVWECA